MQYCLSLKFRHVLSIELIKQLKFKSHAWRREVRLYILINVCLVPIFQASSNYEYFNDVSPILYLKLHQTGDGGMSVMNSNDKI